VLTKKEQVTELRREHRRIIVPLLAAEGFAPYGMTSRRFTAGAVSVVRFQVLTTPRPLCFTVNVGVWLVVGPMSLRDG
jgi:hypothetical protein